MENNDNIVKVGKIQKVETNLERNWLEVKHRSNFFQPIVSESDKKVILKENKKNEKKKNEDKRRKDLYLSFFK